MAEQMAESIYLWFNNEQFISKKIFLVFYQRRAGQIYEFVSFTNKLHVNQQLIVVWNTVIENQK